MLHVLLVLLVKFKHHLIYVDVHPNFGLSSYPLSTSSARLVWAASSDLLMYLRCTLVDYLLLDLSTCLSVMQI